MRDSQLVHHQKELTSSLAPYIKRVPALAKMLKPVAAAYTHLAGYRQMGLKYDDILIEENPEVQKVSLGRCRRGRG